MTKSKVVSVPVVAPVVAPVINIPSFDSTAKTIVDSAVSTATAIDRWLDLCAMHSVPRTIGSAELIRITISEHPILTEAVKVNTIKADTLVEYASGAGRAYYHSCGWSASLKNDPRKKIPDVQGLVKIAGGKKVTVAENLELCDAADAAKAAAKAAKTGAVLPVATVAANVTPKATKSGVVTVSRDTMKACFAEGLRQLRALNEHIAAADILDGILGALPDFKENV